jgi:hypothetical protein
MSDQPGNLPRRLPGESMPPPAGTEPVDPATAEPAAEGLAAAQPGSLEAAAIPRYRELAIGLGAALLLLVVAAATAPFWAGLLPWGTAASYDDAIARLEATQRQTAQQLERRIGALEARPAVQPGDLAELRQQAATLSAGAGDLANRLGQVQKAVQQLQAVDLSGRIAALDRELRARAAAQSELADKIAALERAGQARAAHASADLGLVLALLQIRNAVEAGRPFAAEYDVLAALGAHQPDIAEAAKPLAEPAKTGVAGRAVLAARLRELGRAVAAAGAGGAGTAKGEPGWGESVLSRLRGLVTIRRLGGDDQRAPTGTVNAAELALAGGDLAGAIAALDKLAGPAADSAAPWLHMARQRLAVEQALRRVEALLTERLGGGAEHAAPSPGSSG